MNESKQNNNSAQQQPGFLTQLITTALTESAELISSLGQKQLNMTLEKSGLGTRVDLAGVVNSELTDALAICHTIDGSVPGKIVLLLDDAQAHQLIQTVLDEPHQLMDMSEMEEEALSEMGNIVVNNFLGHVLKDMKHSLITRLPALKRGCVEQIFEGFNSEVTSAFEQDTYYYIRCNVAVSVLEIPVYIFWLNPLFVQQMDSSEINNAKDK